MSEEKTIRLEVTDHVVMAGTTVLGRTTTSYPPSLSDKEFFGTLCAEVGEWSQRNFGDQLPHRPLLGIIEELTELSDAYTMLDRGQILDAVGDVTIYLADYYHRRGWDLVEPWEKYTKSASAMDITTNGLIRNFSHSHLKGEQGIRGGSEVHDAVLRETTTRLFMFLSRICKACDVNYQLIVLQTWMRVSKRDWVNLPDTAHVEAERGDTLRAGYPSPFTESRDTIPDMKMKQIDYEVGDEEHEF
jgi:NTP pyrophosphatase (non-canonical NTP hydrolase)